MRKTELEECPQWLLDADTVNEDVRFNQCGTLEFLGGEFRGGEFRGGYFRGGYFLGGEFLGGYFLGGQFLGGEFLGGEFRGGEFRGGYFRGGYFLGGEFLGGYFRGEALTRTPPVLLKGKWPAVVTPTMLHIGCQHHRHEAWTKFSDGEIAEMAPGATMYWAKNKEVLLLICAKEGAKK